MNLDFKKIIEESAKAKLLMIDECLESIKKASTTMLEAINKGNKILWCGNGGSAADSQHMSAELMGGLRSCLLYTSPSPRDATLSRMPSSA